MSDDEKTIADFRDGVNMTATQIGGRLRTYESRVVGRKPGENGESNGHEVGRGIVRMLHKRPVDHTRADLHQMQRVVSYLHRHLAQKPSGDIEDSHWQYSLINWGHDPLKPGEETHGK